MTRQFILKLSALLFGLAAGTVYSGPITTVPWNGHPGAISFTFDDACWSQLSNVIPNMNSRNIKGTFFVYSGNAFTDNLSDRNQWLAAAAAGHEVTSHTWTHPTLTGLDSVTLVHETAGWADSMQKISPNLRALTLAYPNCATNAMVDRFSDRAYFLARTCGSWQELVHANVTAEPNWMEIIAWPLTGTAATDERQMDTACLDTAWLVTLQHGVGGDWSPIPTATMNSYYDYAITKNMWINTFETVGAYFRASFTMNKVTPSVVTSGWDVAWTSPHPKLPQSIPLRVKLNKTFFGDTITVTQNSTTIAAESDGSYIIDFMKLHMSIRKGSATSAGHSSIAPINATKLSARSDHNTLKISGIKAGEYRVTIFTPNGATIEAHTVRVTDEGQDIAIRIRPSHGLGLASIERTTDSTPGSAVTLLLK